jgi:predicted TPR repeat methyltransferase
LLLAGQRDAAIRQYRKSLQLDPRDENARSVLDELQP